MGKTLLVYNVNLRQLENYNKKFTKTEQNISEEHEKSAECKKQIFQAKRVWKKHSRIQWVFLQKYSIFQTGVSHKRATCSGKRLKRFFFFK